MDPPHLLAIDDVHLTAPACSREALCRLYEDLLGFEAVAGESQRVAFRGMPRSGPRLIIDILEVPPDVPAEKPMRRQALIQVRSLSPYADALADAGISFEWSTGWFYFERRLGLLDPGGNWIELVSSHAW